ncbi:Protein N-terminal and lysine N-methyltransferase efm7 [Paramarasmius palmivorus]|uniref:Protein N-terminal and lysine N-methyltransferase EFM7 n=1 Tax=Paramarasmius palmivorus TaxID=297713 RepID=A0AAW0E2Q8_9AGAR
MNDDGLGLDDIFPEPPRPETPPPTVVSYKEHKIRLVGSHVLWGHYLWNASIALADCFSGEESSFRLDVKGKRVLELGAGGALPSIIAALNGAEKVFITDYPDKPLIENIQYNVDQNVPEELQNRVVVEGFIWGTPFQSTEKFDIIILSDLIFNHSQHEALLRTCEQCLSPTSPTQVLVFYSHHRPHLAHRDMEFFRLARERGWNCEQVVKRKFPPMFPEDSGEEEVRATVWGWSLTRS